MSKRRLTSERIVENDPVGVWIGPVGLQGRDVRARRWIVDPGPVQGRVVISIEVIELKLDVTFRRQPDQPDIRPRMRALPDARQVDVIGVVVTGIAAL